MDKHRLDEIAKEWDEILADFFAQAKLKPQQILVVGCSTSEVLGERIGKAGSLGVAEALWPSLYAWCEREGVFLAVQGCEHINRALVVERRCAEFYRLEEVTVVPALKAGGAMAVKAYREFEDPVMVEEIKAHAGIDIGDTLIGMHLRPVAVPLRLVLRQLGQAHITAARTRPRLIGGPRAEYPA